MESELSQELLGQIADHRYEVANQLPLARPIQTGIGKGVKRFQAWQYLIFAFAAFWICFAIILIASGYYFLLVALAILALLSSVIVGLAWAFQNNI